MDEEHRQHLIDTCNEEGAGSTYVLNTDGSRPSYMVTYGWSFDFDLPEFIIFGGSTMISQWNRIYNELIEATDAPMVVDDFHSWPILFNGHAVVSRKVDASNVTDNWFEDPLECRRLAGVSEGMVAHQLFWADSDGNMPWDEGPFSTTLRWLQPPLYQPHIKPTDDRPRLESLRHRAETLTLCNP